MTIWLIEPHDPLIVREGRPFGPNPGAMATSLLFPFPSTIAGGVRTRSALDEHRAFKYDRQDAHERELIKQLKEISIRGPLLVQIANEDNTTAQPEVNEWLVPMPNDVQLLDISSQEKAFLQRLVPLNSFADAQTDFDPQKNEKQLYFVGPERAAPQKLKRKPLSHELRYWYWEKFQTWLSEPTKLEQEDGVLLSSLGRKDIMREHRLHVSIDSEKETGKEGLLFGTSGLEFTHPGAGKARLHDAHRLALAVDVDDKLALRPGIASFGGERRMVAWRQSNAQFPKCPDTIKEAIKSTGHCRLVLLTPVSFTQGYYPTWLQSGHAQKSGAKAEVKAITVRRPQVVSGWDLLLGTPKPSRRLAPAGTVLFLSIKGNAAERAAWIEQTWMRSISDEEQDRRDGFGLAALGTWSGEPAAMQSMQ